MIWHRRAALNTPWNPWGDELFRIDGDHVTLYDATHITDAVLQSRFDVANMTPKQLTSADMLVLSANDADFGGHSAFASGASTSCLKTGVFTTPIPSICTHYFALKTPPSGTRELMDRTNVGPVGRQILYTIDGLIYMSGASAAVAAALPGNSIAIVSLVFNTTSSAIYVNSTTAAATGTTDPGALSSITLGNYYGLTAPWTGKFAHHSIFAGVPDAALHARRLRYLGDQYKRAIA